MTPTTPRRLSVHLQGLIAALVATAVLALALLGLHLRRNGLPVDPSEMQMAADSPCMVQALRDAPPGLTYGQLDGLKARCGE